MKISQQQFEALRKIFNNPSATQRQLAKDLEHYLSHWLNSEFPENAWDAFIMNSVSQHYAFTSMMAIRDESVLRIPAFDNNILDI